MTKRRTARAMLAVGFWVLLVDGAAAIWLGQVSGRPVLVGVGVALVLAALAVTAAYRRWMIALEAVAAARDDLKAEVGRLRDAADAARTGRPPLA